jgi:DNA invertase Pin-like site-specific DNA recombinase
MTERRQARRNRRRRLRRREPRFNNRSRKGYIAPSQYMLVKIRINMIKNLAKIYPISEVAIEDVCFNHAKKKIWKELFHNGSWKE